MSGSSRWQVARWSLGSLLAAGLMAAGCGDGPSPAATQQPPAARQQRPAARQHAPIEGRFEVLRGALGEGSTTVVLGDCDGDGRLDALRTGVANHHMIPPAQREPPRIWRGVGGGRFEPVPGEPLFHHATNTGVFTDVDRDGVDDIILAAPGAWLLRGLGACRYERARELHPELRMLNPLALRTDDVDLDGLTDLVVSVHGPVPLPYTIVLGRGDGGYDISHVVPEPLTPSPEGYVPYGLLLDDVDGDGVRDIFAMLDTHRAWFSWGVRGGGAAGVRDRAVTDLFDRVNPMAMAVLDADLDGRLDYFVSGVQSASLLLHYAGERRIINRASEAGVEGVGPSFAWGAAALDVDRDGRQDIVVLREDESIDPMRVHGPTDVFINRGDGRFSEVGETVVGASFEAKGLVCGDLEGDGVASCIAMDRGGPVVLRNQVRQRQGWVGLRLRGTTSAPEADGARVTVLGASHPRIYHYGAHASYAVEHPRDLVIAAEGPSMRVRIEWPSGVVQESDAFPTGEYSVVREPEVLRVSRRVAPADGATTVLVTGGVPGDDARVELSVEGNARIVDAPTSPPEGSVEGVRRWELSSAQPGEVRLTLRVDGVELRVRPRIIFTAPPM